jgi:hypothetical protein
MRQLHSTLVAVASLGGLAHADTVIQNVPAMADEAAVSKSHRGVAQDYLVAPEGGELTGQMKFITADSILAGQPLKFTDLALFELGGRWSLFGKLELAAQVDLLPKQPSYTDEKPWQSVGGTLRSPLGHDVAIAVSGGGGHLIDHVGMWTHEALMIEWKKPIDREFLAFDVEGGIDGVGLSAPHTTASAFLTELAMQASTLFHEPSGHWGAWLGIGYAVPVQASGRDPTTNMAIDPQPRLDFHAGTVLSIDKRWDLFVDFAVVDRGDAANPATRLPILDGGFDQKQIVFGITRHIAAPRRHHDDDDEAYVSTLGE